ncbi:heme-dependent oxidative N-demethylase family protein [Roseibaca sp. Y0-43]|uniref:heme-dependent oxidative N-demethylase family protein n=1 Tax=Roseibaca sp. Y0-43 TaxID=2816854 RepID=UPI001D0CC86F|nr:DUF3445 domain-containing protein [Roseibaca sp. Y0-43]MCC1482309.1 DUF3445 domain-containing protein [Roseibaca sp. Y0-43]
MILNARLPFAPWVDPARRRLPGVMPLARDEWLLISDAYAAQMAERARLLADRPAEVTACLAEAEDAAAELLATVLGDLPALGFTCDGPRITCPDGRRVDLSALPPLHALGLLVQEDFCILQKRDGADEHVLTGAVLCFPSSWTLAQKLGRPLLRIHAPVESYDSQMGARVQRMFDAIRPEQPLWRANLLRYTNAALYQPRQEYAPKDKRDDGDFIRSERQCLLRLAQSRAVVFSIHTAQVRRADLTKAQAQALAEILD